MTYRFATQVRAPSGLVIEHKMTEAKIYGRKNTWWNSDRYCTNFDPGGFRNAGTRAIYNKSVYAQLWTDQ